MHFFIYLAILILSIHPVNAHLHDDSETDKVFNYKTPKNIEPYPAIEHAEEYYGCSGHLRTGFIQTSINTTKNTSASALAAELGCGYRLNSHIKAHLGLFGVLDSGLNSHNDSNIHPDFFNASKDSYLMLGEAVLTLSYANLEAYLGRQSFDSPHLDGDDLRMVANLFEAYLIDYHFNPEIYFGTGFIREASGWENGANSAEFISIGEALGGQEAGAWVNWLSYTQANLTSELWLYLIPEHLNIVYAELNHSGQIHENIAYNLGFQYDWGQSIGNAELGEIENHTVGIMGAISSMGFTATAAYNQNFGKSSALASVGGGAFFTSLEDQTLDAVTANAAHSFLIGLDYTLNPAINIGFAMGEFSAKHHAEYQTQEFNYFINYNWHDTLTAELIYAVVDDKNSPADTNQFRAIITYRY